MGMLPELPTDPLSTAAVFLVQPRRSERLPVRRIDPLRVSTALRGPGEGPGHELVEARGPRGILLSRFPARLAAGHP
jgi:hypothetical protein